MDLTAVANGAVGVFGVILAPVSVMLAKRMLALAQTKLHLHLTAQNEAAIENAVSSAAGMLRARMAAGTMTLHDVTTGSGHLDDAVNLAMTVAEVAGVQAGVTRYTLAAQIVGVLGHALGEDPSVPSLGAPTAEAPAVVAPKP